MLKNIFKKIGRIILTNLSFIIAFIIIIFVFTFEFPYTIASPGKLINMQDRIKVEKTNTISGSYNMTYVETRKLTIPTLIISYFNKSWDVYKNSDFMGENITPEENDKIGRITLKESNDNAIINAYREAGLDVEVKSEKVCIISIDENADTDLKIGDEIISVDGVKVESATHLSRLSNIYSEGDKVNFEVMSGGKKYNRYAYVYNAGQKVFGIYVKLNKDLEYSPKVEFNFGKNEYGSSAGLMEALYIYDCLIEKDLSNGLKIAGTGAIDTEGNILEISEVKYKLESAVKEGADIFFVPGVNYDEIKDEQTGNTKIVPVNLFSDAIFYLYNYQK